MIHNKQRSGQTGKVKINFVAIFMFLAIIVVFFSAFKFGPPYYHDRNFEGFLNMQARNSMEWENETIEANISKYAEENGIELKNGNWSVYRTDTHIYIRVQYLKIINIPFDLSRAIRFEHDIKQEIKPLAQL